MIESWHTRFVIGGFPRAGTTLLRTLLDAHTELIVPAETGFFLRDLEYRRANSVRLARSALRVQEALPYLSLSEIEAQILDGHSQIEVFDGLMRRASDHLGYGASGWGEKTPRNIEHFERLHEARPDLKLIIVVRDGRDVVTSRIPGRDCYHCSIERFLATAQAIIRCSAIPKETLRYEDLVTDPASTLEKLQWFLGLEPENLIRQVADHSPNRMSHLKNQPRVASAVTAVRVDRWKRPEFEERIKEFENNPEAVSANVALGYSG